VRFPVYSIATDMLKACAQCPFVGPADPGPCTGSPGTLSFAEIGDIISKNNLEPVLDEDAAVKYVDYLSSIVGGSMIWSGTSVGSTFCASY
jgi:hypothetical protein